MDEDTAKTIIEQVSALVRQLHQQDISYICVDVTTEHPQILCYFRGGSKTPLDDRDASHIEQVRNVLREFDPAGRVTFVAYDPIMGFGQCRTPEGLVAI